MKKHFKSLFTISVILTALSFPRETLADSTGTRCPNPPSQDYISICGFVKSAVATTEIEGGEEITTALAPVENVSVYLYECNNASPTCKNNGNLVHPFASTSTNKDGRFYLIARKVDGTTLLRSKSRVIEDAVVPSKRRYLVFACGKRFAGLQAIPSYQNLPDLIQEVKCTEKDFYYMEPPSVYKFFNNDETLAAQMGLEGETPAPAGETNKTIQAAYNEPPEVDVEINLKIEGADPRFSQISTGDYIQMASATLGHSANPGKGAFWSLDCHVKYAGDPDIEKECMQKLARNSSLDDILRSMNLTTKNGEIYFRDGAGYAWGDPIMSVSELQRIIEEGSEEEIRDLQIMLYELRLYYDPEMLIQNKLANIPPRNAILFYKELPARQDLTQYIQDPTDVARFLSSQFSNCIGEVFLRHAGEEKESTYPDCEEFKKCNTTITSDGINSYTTGGPAMWLSSPVDNVKAFESVDLNSPVCDHNGAIIKLKDIQPSWDIGSGENYILGKSYWNPEFLYYFGQNNVSTKYGNKFFSSNDSFTASSGPGGVDKEPFRAFEEGAGTKIQSGTSAIIPNDKRRPNNSVAAAVSILPKTNFFSSPTKAKDPLYKENILTNYTISSLGGKARLTSLYSNVNSKPEQVITNPTEDLSFFNNSWFRGELHHYPWQDLVDPGSIYNIWQTLRNIIDVARIGNPTNEAITGYYTSLGFIKQGNDLYQMDPLTQTLEKWGSLDKFVREYKEEIISYQLGLENNQPDVQDGTRTGTTAWFFTSAAFRRLLSLSYFIRTRTDYDGNDFIDSLYSAMIGNGVLAPSYSIGASVLQNLQDVYDQLKDRSVDQLEKDITDATFDAIKKLIDETQKYGIQNDDDMKTFFDRKNIEAKYGVPGYVDDIKTTFGLSEETFIKDKDHPDGAFPLPNKEEPFDDDKLYWLDIEDWGEHACYPWNKVSINGSCDTSKEESVDKVSRTCRVDWCRKAETKLKWKCTKGRDLGGGLVKPNQDYDGYEIIITDGPNWQCSRVPEEGRLICAQKQKSCLDGDGNIVSGGSSDTHECMEETYEDDIENAREKAEEEGIPSCPTDALAYAYPHTTREISLTINTPACTVSAAGPFVCNGDLQKISTLKSTQEVLRANNDAVAVDDIAIADNELRMSLQSPQEDIYHEAFTAVSHGIYSADSSIKPADTSRNISTGKDSYGLGASNVNSGYIRSLFAAPAAKSSTVTYNPYSIHCKNTELLGAGGWDCETQAMPEPEIADIEALNIDQSCALNMSKKCKELIFARTIASSSASSGLDIPPNSMEFSDTFYRIISAAGTRFNVPASVILTYMAGIGKLNEYEYYWSEAGEKKLLLASAPWYGTFPRCDDTAIGAVGSYDWLLFWFNFSIKNIAVAPVALDEIAENRSTTASRCNFMDSTYITAAALYNEGPRTGCSGWTMENSARTLKALTFGQDSTGTSYSRDTRYFGWQNLRDIFTYCKY